MNFRAFLALACGFITLLCWAIASPIGSSPDDDFHLPSIWCARGSIEGVCDTTPPGEGALVPAPIRNASFCYRLKPNESAGCQADTVDSEACSLEKVTRANIKLKVYPPGYYLFHSWFVGRDTLVSALVMRVLNAIIAVILIGALIKLSRGSSIDYAVRYTWIMLSVPLGLFIIPSNNPSSWTVLGIGTYWGFLYLLLVSPGSSSTSSRARLQATWLCAFIAALLANSSRTDGSVYVVLSTVAVLLLTSDKLGDVLSPLKKPRVLSLVLSVIGLSLSVFLTSQHATTIATQGIEPRATTNYSIGALLFHNVQVISLWHGAVGGWSLGWLDTPMPVSVPTIVFSLAFYGAVAGLQGSRVTKILGVGIVVFALTFIPLWALTRAGRIIGETVQPRYLLPLLYLALGLALTKQRAQDRAVASPLTNVTFAFLLAFAHSLALHQNLKRYVAGLAVADINLNHVVTWWWTFAPSPLAVWLIASFSFLVLALVLLTERAPASSHHKTSR